MALGRFKWRGGFALAVFLGLLGLDPGDARAEAGLGGAPSAALPGESSPNGSGSPDQPNAAPNSATAPPEGPLGRLRLEPLAEPVEISLGRKNGYEIRVSSREIDANKRAKAATAALQHAIERPDSVDVRVERQNDRAVLYAGSTVVLQLFPEDAEAHQDASLDVHAARVAMSLGDYVDAERQRRTWAGRVFSVSLVVLMLLVAIALLSKTSDVAKKWRQWLESHRAEVPAIRVQSLELLGSAAVRSALVLALEVGKWLLRLVIVYLWLLLSLGQFDRTRGLLAGFTGTLLLPLTEALRRSALALPLAGVLLLAAASVAVLLRFIQLFFAGVARGEAEIPWVRKERAQPVSQLLHLGVILSALLFLAPLLTGTADGMLPRAGLVWLLALAVGASPLVASLFVGLTHVFGERLEAGGRVRFGGREGIIVEVGLLALTLRTDTGRTVVVPQLLGLFHPTELLSARGSFFVDVPLERVSSAALELLTDVARSFDAAAHAEFVHVEHGACLARISFESTDHRAAPRLLLAAAEALERAGIPLGRHPGSRLS